MYIFFDNTATVLSIGAMLLCMFRYSEFALLNLLANIIGLILYIIVTCEDISNLVWVIYTAYVLVCQAVAFFKMNKRF